MRNEKAFYLERKKNKCLERKMRKHASQELWLRSRSEYPQEQNHDEG